MPWKDMDDLRKVALIVNSHDWQPGVSGIAVLALVVLYRRISAADWHGPC